MKVLFATDRAEPSHPAGGRVARVADLARTHGRGLPPEGVAFHIGK
jgi:hypothetical protein